MENQDKILKMLNDALAQEHACQIRYLTHAAVITGPYADNARASLARILVVKAQELTLKLWINPPVDAAPVRTTSFH